MEHPVKHDEGREPQFKQNNRNSRKTQGEGHGNADENQNKKPGDQHRRSGGGIKDHDSVLFRFRNWATSSDSR